MILSGTLLLLVCISLAIIRRQGCRDRFSLLHLLAFYYIANGVVGPLYFVFREASRQRFGYTVHDLQYSTLLFLLSWCGIAAGYLLFRWTSLSATMLRLVGGRSLRMSLLIPALVLGWSSRVVVVLSGRYFHVADNASALDSGPLTFIVIVLAQLPLLCLFLVMARQGSRQVERDFLMLGLITSEFAWALPTGSRASIVTLLLGILVVRYYSVGSVPRTWIAAALVLAVLAFPIVFNYRALKVQTPGAQVSITDLVAPTGVSFIEAAPDAVASRFSDVEAIATAVHRSEYLGGLLDARKLGELVWAAVIPRALWKDKPDAHLFGNEFGRAAGVIYDGDKVTSISVPIPLMWWFVGGVLMVAIGSFLTGIVYRAVDALFSARNSSGLAAAVYGASAFLLLTSPATILPAGLGGVLKSSLTLLLIGFLMSQSATGSSADRGV